jgi:spermidine/putrescine-binding protein
VEQKKVLQGYTMDGIFSKMEGGNAAAGMYYAGDCLSMIDENEDLSLYYPVEGTNVFVDSICIPKNAQNVPAAEAFINFLLDEEIAVENALYLYYASPNLKVQENEYYQEEMGDNYALLYEYPEQYLTEDGKLDVTVAQYYHNLAEIPLKNKKEEELGDTVLNYMTELWIRLKLM